MQSLRQGMNSPETKYQTRTKRELFKIINDFNKHAMPDILLPYHSDVKDLLKHLITHFHTKISGISINLDQVIFSDQIKNFRNNTVRCLFSNFEPARVEEVAEIFLFKSQINHIILIKFQHGLSKNM